jgi:hypothetical protein
MSKGLRILIATAAAVLLAAAAAHAVAYASWRASFGSGSYAERLAAAKRAAALEPFNPSFRARPEWVRGTESTKAGRPGDAYYYLHRAIDADPGNEQLRAEFKQAYRAWYDATTWKAHVQHQRELTGGVLPEDRVIP